ncbi:hypothetical protein ACIBHX_46900 [Nonomuraea sp. NPDC050536]|uniref:hypothetical protein n=1 Tax=Nonomuraea sp. NPDC050536 TaxID=3364366 RepID=UPI0037C9B396
MWTGELLRDRLAFTLDAEGLLRLSYQDSQRDDWEHGVLWVRHGQDRSGTHKWKAINTPRTRLMMRDYLCMVCTGPCSDRETARVSWLLVDDPEISPDGQPVTNVPPTCTSCIPEALEACPKLGEHSRVITVAGAKPIAFAADLFKPSAIDGTPMKIAHEVNIPLDAGNVLRGALAKHLWVELLDMRAAPRPQRQPTSSL